MGPIEGSLSPAGAQVCQAGQSFLSHPVHLADLEEVREEERGHENRLPGMPMATNFIHVEIKAFCLILVSSQFLSI